MCALKVIPTRIRAQIINDAFALSEAGEISPVKAFEIISYLVEETDYLPWSTAINCLKYLTNMLDTKVSFGNYQKFVLELVTPMYNTLGWVEKDDESWPNK